MITGDSMSHTLPPRTILIVDDSQLYLNVLNKILEDEYHIKLAKDGQEAISQAKSAPIPDMILLDIELPDMDGYQVLSHLQQDEQTQQIPVIFITSKSEESDEERGLRRGAVDYISKPISKTIVRARVKTHLTLLSYQQQLEERVKQRTAELEQMQNSLREAMQNLLTVEVTAGVYWIQIPEAELYILCGCPGEVVKHLKKQGFIKRVSREGVEYESGPNVILLSDLLVQNGNISNLAEFPVLQMLYRQGMILPGHPNNRGVKPLLVGSREQVEAQLSYIHCGNYGLTTLEEMMACGASREEAERYMKIKLHFAFNAIHPPDKFIDSLILEGEAREIRNGVTVERIAANEFRFQYRGKETTVNLTLPAGVVYEQPYTLGRHHVERHYLSVLHSGEGDGWDANRPSMSAILIFQGRIFLVDAGPNVMSSLTALGIDISEVEGIFHTHCHDDHFAGLPALIRTDRKLTYFASPLVRASVAKKFAALVSLTEREFERFFEVRDLNFNQWNDCDGLEVMPLYSPHPVENNLFLFKAIDSDGQEKSYAHWADLSAFSVLDAMLQNYPELGRDYIEQIKQHYLTAADIKKIDIGGGLIHGMAQDFKGDNSNRLLLAHIDRELTLNELEIGSASYFGVLDTLIAGEQDYLRVRAAYYVGTLFSKVSKNQLRILLDCPIVELNAGTLIVRLDRVCDHIYIVLSGTVAYIDAANRVHNTLAYGSFIGIQTLLNDSCLDRGTYIAVSHCRLLSISSRLFNYFLEKNQLLDSMQQIITKVSFLRRTWLFGEEITFLTLESMLEYIQYHQCDRGEIIHANPTDRLYLIETGSVEWLNSFGEVEFTLQAGEFFGEAHYVDIVHYRMAEGVKLVSLPLEKMQQIPIVYWKMLETMSKRNKALFS
ncbi:response regulator [Ectothiorhodospiraceae bacterium BW-2]|nr:response regulator [Ectothiorhodospiraceae bacterium BW-2]